MKTYTISLSPPSPLKLKLLKLQNYQFFLFFFKILNYQKNLETDITYVSSDYDRTINYGYNEHYLP